jgi:hypothetical protein
MAIKMSVFLRRFQKYKLTLVTLYSEFPTFLESKMPFSQEMAKYKEKRIF